MQTEQRHHEETRAERTHAGAGTKPTPAERWTSQRRRIREIRASMKGEITAQALINKCIAEELFSSDDLEAFVIEGMKRRVLNAVRDMRTGRRG